MKAILTGFGLLLALGTAAQGTGGPFIGFGYGTSGVDPDALNVFVNSYNHYYRVGLQKGLTPYSQDNQKEWHISAGWRKVGPGLNYSFSYAYSRNRFVNGSVLHNGLGYEFTSRLRTHDLRMEVGGSIGPLGISAQLGFPFRWTDMSVATIYQDGSRSMGYEYGINGFYKSVGMGFDPGIVIGARVWRFYVPLRVSWLLPMFKDETGMTDEDFHRRRSSAFPADFEAWVADPDGLDFDNVLSVNSFYHGLRISIGAECIFPLKGATR